jgi:hypothetical protein
MNELDEFWAEALEEMKRRATGAGRGDVADYLTLKSRNDSLRAASAKWLFETFAEAAREATSVGGETKMETNSPHRFDHNRASCVGSMLSFSRGVRLLTVEAGWTRTPSDGFMRGGALAAARVIHFGMGKYNADLMLTSADVGAPVWLEVDKTGKKRVFDSSSIREHVRIFLNDV